MKNLKKHPRYIAAPWIEANRSVIQEYAKSHSCKQTSRFFDVTVPALNAAQIHFPKQRTKLHLTQQQFEFRIIAASLLKRTGAGKKKIAGTVGLSTKQLAKYGIAPVYPVGWPSVDIEKVQAAENLVDGGASQRDAAAQAGISRRTWQVRRKEL